MKLSCLESLLTDRSIAPYLTLLLRLLHSGAPSGHLPYLDWVTSILLKHCEEMGDIYP